MGSATVRTGTLDRRRGAAARGLDRARRDRRHAPRPGAPRRVRAASGGGTPRRPAGGGAVGARRCGGSEPHQGRVSRHAEPRAPQSDERHPRLDLGAAPRRRPRRPRAGRRGARARAGYHRAQRAGAAAPDRGPARCVADRSGQAGPLHRTGRPRRGRARRGRHRAAGRRRQGPRDARRSGRWRVHHRRRRPTDPGGPQPPLQRDQVHRRGLGERHAAQGRRGSDAPGRRHRVRHPRGLRAACVRSLPAGGQRRHPQRGRPGGWAFRSPGR